MNSILLSSLRQFHKTLEFQGLMMFAS